MAMPKSVMKIRKKDGVTFESKVDQASYTIDELSRRALYDTAKFVRREMIQELKKMPGMKRNRYEEENKEILAKKRRVYYEENKERIAESKKLSVARNKEKYARYYLEWARANVDKCKEKRHRREARLKKLPHTLTAEQWQKILGDFNEECAYCGNKEEIQQEHFIALNKGGEYTHNNIIPACRICNSSKQDADFFEWYPKQEFYSQQRESKILEYLNYTNTGTQQLALTL